MMTRLYGNYFRTKLERGGARDDRYSSSNRGVKSLSSACFKDVQKTDCLQKPKQTQTVRAGTQRKNADVTNYLTTLDSKFKARNQV